MAAIVPRWEWRVFGEDLEPAESRLAALAPDRVRESDEVYLLAPGSDASGLVAVSGARMWARIGPERIDPAR